MAWWTGKHPIINQRKTVQEVYSRDHSVWINSTHGRKSYYVSHADFYFECEVVNFKRRGGPQLSTAAYIIKS